MSGSIMFKLITVLNISTTDKQICRRWACVFQNCSVFQSGLPRAKDVQISNYLHIQPQLLFFLPLIRRLEMLVPMHLCRKVFFVFRLLSVLGICLIPKN